MFGIFFLITSWLLPLSFLTSQPFPSGCPTLVPQWTQFACSGSCCGALVKVDQLRLQQESSESKAKGRKYKPIPTAKLLGARHDPSRTLWWGVLWRSQKPQGLINHQHSLFSTSPIRPSWVTVSITRYWPKKVGDDGKASREVEAEGKSLKWMTVDQSSQTSHMVQLHEQEEPGYTSVPNRSPPRVIPTFPKSIFVTCLKSCFFFLNFITADKGTVRYKRMSHSHWITNSISRFFPDFSRGKRTKGRDGSTKDILHLLCAFAVVSPDYLHVSPLLSEELLILQQPELQRRDGKCGEMCRDFV